MHLVAFSLPERYLLFNLGPNLLLICSSSEIPATFRFDLVKIFPISSWADCYLVEAKRLRALYTVRMIYKCEF